MKFGNFGSFINYIRNHILEQPTKELEGDDLQINIYDNEICFIVNDLYDGPQITYMPSREKQIDVVFRKVEKDLDEDSANINIEQVKQVAAIVLLIEDNKDILDKFLLREEK